MKKRVLFVLVDTTADRIVDYVNLASDDAPVDVTGALGSDSPKFGRTNYLADGNIGSMWLTNRSPDPSLSSDCRLPTYGTLNQINVGLGIITANLPWVSQVPPVQDPWAAIDFFRTNLLHTNAIYGTSGPLYLTNHFYAPYVPSRTNYIYNWWQAKDPLVHYTVSDLTVNTNRNFLSPTARAYGDIGGLDPAYLGQTPPVYVLVGSQVPINYRSEPWGCHPGGGRPSTTAYELAVKDPLVACPDDWDFPTGQSLDVSWLGRVHRGTPWQTIYLKSAGIDFPTWRSWSGNLLVETNWGQIDPHLLPLGNAIADAALSFPPNDWRLAGLLAWLFSTESPQDLLSVNDPSLPAWCGVMDGITVLTNTVTEDQLVALYPPQFSTMPIESNSPQASMIAEGIAANRSAQPGHYFRQLGDILAVPELTVGRPYLTNAYWAEVSPFLNLGSYLDPDSISLTIQQTKGINDAAYEAIPAQLLARLRPDSIGSALPAGPNLQLQFTGLDGYDYAVEVSTNLMTWTAFSTNSPSNGSFTVLAPAAGSDRRFYRSVLLP